MQKRYSETNRGNYITSGLKKVATLPLHIHYDDHDGKIVCQFSKTSTIHSPPHSTTIETVDCYITGDLAFQAMSMGRESMAGYWCLLCCANRPQFQGDYPPWLMEDLCRLGDEAAQDGIELDQWVPPGVKARVTIRKIKETHLRHDNQPPSCAGTRSTPPSDQAQFFEVPSNLVHGVISLAVAAAGWVGVSSPGDYAAIEFPPTPRHDLHPILSMLF